MKKNAIIIIIIIFYSFGIGELNAQNMNVSGAGSDNTNGIYVDLGGTNDGVPYYVKDELYLYRWTSGSTNKYWTIGTVLNSGMGTNYYYITQSSNPTPDGLTFSGTGALGETPYPTVNDTPLPVELSSFTVETANHGVVCKWTTESEIENLGFILERKTEGTGWIEIASYKTDEGLLGQGSISSATDYEYLDVLVEPNTTYEYRLADVDYNGIVTYHAIREVAVDQAPLASMVEEFTVLPAYPNPFNPSTTITYGIDTDSKITVQIYDITGQLISTLQDNYQTQGWYSVIWNGTNQHGTQVPAGIYLSKITAGNEVKTTKLMLLK